MDSSETPTTAPQNLRQLIESAAEKGKRLASDCDPQETLSTLERISWWWRYMEEPVEHDSSALRDTGSTDKVLVATRFAYWGGHGPAIPDEFQDFDGQCLSIHTPAHKSRFSEEFVRRFSEWFHALGMQGIYDTPDDWRIDP